MTSPGIIQRIFGLVQVEIKTAGGGTDKATISALTKEEASHLRSILRDQELILKGEDSQDFDTVNVEKIEWRLSNRDLFYGFNFR